MANILLIDDDEQVIKVLLSYLETGGHEITTANDGKQGIQMLMTRQFDLVITDILMPDKTGLDVQMWLNGKTNRPKVIAISGGSPSFDQNFLLKLSEGLAADKILPKPFNRETLNQAVADVLQ